MLDQTLGQSPVGYSHATLINREGHGATRHRDLRVWSLLGASGLGVRM
jgi:hypothetical protein